RREGLAETGVGSVTCARHTFLMPQGTVNFHKGERFSHTDFAIGTVLSRVVDEGQRDVGLHYDIVCHYVKNMWDRYSRLPYPAGPLRRPDFDTFLTGIPKFHLAGHVDDCYAQYSLNNMSGVGRLDAEGSERCWATLNNAAASSSEKGPGARMDSLNHVMHYWNWMKTVGMGRFLLLPPQ
ncbi:hypothetical protein BDV93DRAFT_459331, partial [Ceratobasidium sp. AG-I]